MRGMHGTRHACERRWRSCDGDKRWMCQLSKQRQRLGETSTEKAARALSRDKSTEVSTTRPSSPHKPLAHGSTPDVHGMPAPPLHRLPRKRNWQSTCNESNWTDGAAFHVSTPFLCLRQTGVLSTYSSHSRRLTRSLSFRQLHGYREDWIAGQALARAMQTARANRQPQLKGCGARWHSSSLT